MIKTKEYGEGTIICEGIRIPKDCIVIEDYDAEAQELVIKLFYKGKMQTQQVFAKRLVEDPFYIFPSEIDALKIVLPGIINFYKLKELFG